MRRVVLVAIATTPTRTLCKTVYCYFVHSPHFVIYFSFPPLFFSFPSLFPPSLPENEDVRHFFRGGSLLPHDNNACEREEGKRGINKRENTDPNHHGKLPIVRGTGIVTAKSHDRKRWRQAKSRSANDKQQSMRSPNLSVSSSRL